MPPILSPNEGQPSQSVVTSTDGVDEPGLVWACGADQQPLAVSTAEFSLPLGAEAAAAAAGRRPLWSLAPPYDEASGALQASSGGFPILCRSQDLSARTTCL